MPEVNCPECGAPLQLKFNVVKVECGLNAAWRKRLMAKLPPDIRKLILSVEEDTDTIRIRIAWVGGGKGWTRVVNVFREFGGVWIRDDENLRQSHFRVHKEGLK